MDQEQKWICNVPEHQFERFKNSRIAGRRGTTVVKGEPKPTGDETLQQAKDKGWVGVYEVVAEIAPSPGRPGEEMTMEGQKPS